MCLAWTLALFGPYRTEECRESRESTTISHESERHHSWVQGQWMCIETTPIEGKSHSCARIQQRWDQRWIFVFNVWSIHHPILCSVQLERSTWIHGLQHWVRFVTVESMASRQERFKAFHVRYATLTRFWCGIHNTKWNAHSNFMCMMKCSYCLRWCI